MPGTKKTRPPKSRTDNLVREVKNLMADDLISTIYRERIRAARTRRFDLNAVAKANSIIIMHTLLGIELKIGRCRILCPDLTTAKYLSVFARLGVQTVAVPYDITQISRLAEDLDSSFSKMLLLTASLSTDHGERILKRAVNALIKDQRDQINSIGSGPAMPQFNQNTKQRRPQNS